MARLRQKRRDNRKASMSTTRDGKGRIVKAGHIAPARPSISIGSGPSVPQQEIVFDSAAPVSTYTGDHEVSVTTLTVPVVAHRASRSMRGSVILRANDFGDAATVTPDGNSERRNSSFRRPQKRPSIFQLLPDLQGPVANQEMMDMFAELPFSSEDDGEDDTYGEGNGGTRPILKVSVQDAGETFSATDFFDKLDTAATPGSFVPFGQRDRVAGRGSISLLNASQLGSASRTFRRGQGSKIGTSGISAISESARKRKKKRKSKREQEAEDAALFGGMDFGDSPKSPKTAKRRGRRRVVGGPSASASEIPLAPPLPEIEVPSLSFAPAYDDDGNLLILEGDEDAAAAAENGDREGSVDDFGELDRLTKKFEEQLAAKKQAEIDKVRREEGSAEAARLAAAASVMPADTAGELKRALHGSDEDQALLASLLAEADINLHEPIVEESPPSELLPPADLSVPSTPRVRPLDWAPELAFQTPEMLAAIALAKERKTDADWQLKERKRIAQLLGIDSSSDEEDSQDEIRTLRRRIRKKILPLIASYRASKPKSMKPVKIAFGRVFTGGDGRPRSRSQSRNCRPRPGSSSIKPPRTQLQQELADLLGMEDEQLDTIAAVLEGEAEARVLLQAMAEARAKARAQVVAAAVSTVLTEGRVAASSLEGEGASGTDIDAGIVSLELYSREADEIPLPLLPPLPPSPASGVSTPIDSMSLLGGLSPAFGSFSIDYRLPPTPGGGSFAYPTSTRSAPGVSSAQFALNDPSDAMAGGLINEQAMSGTGGPQTPPPAGVDRLDGLVATHAKSPVIIVESARSRRGSQSSTLHWTQTLDVWSPRTRVRLLQGGVSEAEIESAVDVAMSLSLHQRTPSESRRTSVSGKFGALPITKTEDASSPVVNARQAWLISQMQQGALEANIQARVAQKARERRRELHEQVKKDERKALLERQHAERARLEDLVDPEVLLAKFEAELAEPDTVSEFDSAISSVDSDESSSSDSDDDETGGGGGSTHVESALAPLVMPDEIARLPPSLARKKHPAPMLKEPKMLPGEMLAASERDKRARKAAVRAARKLERDLRLALLKPRKKRPPRSSGVPLYSSEDDCAQKTTTVIVDNGPIEAPTKQRRTSVAVFGERNRPPPALQRVDYTSDEFDHRYDQDSDVRDGDSSPTHPKLRRGIMARKVARTVIVTKQELEEQQIAPSYLPSLQVHLLAGENVSGSEVNTTGGIAHTMPGGTQRPVSEPSASESTFHGQQSVVAPLPQEYFHTFASAAVGLVHPSEEPLRVASSRLPTRVQSTSRSTPRSFVRTAQAAFEQSKKECKDEVSTQEENDVHANEEPPLSARQRRTGACSIPHNSSPADSGILEVLPCDLPMLGRGQPRDCSSRPPLSSAGRFIAGSIRVAPSQTRRMAREAADALVVREQREAHDYQEQIGAWKRMRAEEAAREERRRRIKARRVMSPADAETDRRLEEKEVGRNLHEDTSVQRGVSLTAGLPQFTHSQEEKSEPTLSDGAEVLSFGQFQFVDRPNSSASEFGQNIVPHSGHGAAVMMDQRSDPHALGDLTPVRSPSPLLPGFMYHEAASLGKRHGRDELEAAHRPWTVYGAPAAAENDEPTRSNEEARVRIGWMQRMRIARGTAISIRPGTHDPMSTRKAIGHFAYDSASGGSEIPHSIVPQHPPLPPSRGTFSRVGIASRDVSREVHHTGRGVHSHDRRHTRQFSPPRGVPASLPIMTPLTAPVQSFNVPPTAQQDINAALKGTLVAPRFIAPTSAGQSSRHRLRTSPVVPLPLPPRPSLPKLSATSTFLPVSAVSMQVDAGSLGHANPSGSSSARESGIHSSVRRGGSKTARDRLSPRISPSSSAQAF